MYLYSQSGGQILVKWTKQRYKGQTKLCNPVGQRNSDSICRVCRDRALKSVYIIDYCPIVT